VKLKIFLILVFVVAVAFVFYLKKEREGTQLGDKAPDFKLPSQSGMVSLSQYRGSVVLLNFWASWCPPCRAEMPSLEALQKKMTGKKFQLLAVSVDEEGWGAVNRFLQYVPLTMTILLDSPGDVAALYGTYQLPASFLIDKKGDIVKEYLGPRDWTSDEIVEEIQKQVDIAY
jgi:peroxiredoxin